LCECEEAACTAALAEESEKSKEQQRAALLAGSGLRGKYGRMTLKTIKPHAGNQSAVNAVRKWLSGWPQTRGIVFYGQPGRGKSHFAAGITMALINHLVRAEFWPSPKLLESMMKQGENAPRFHIDRFVKLPVLVIDDLGKEKLSEWAYQQIFRLIEERDILERPLIITMNDAPDRMMSRIGDAAVSRLVGNSAWIEITGDDWRTKGESRYAN
jgi:DNA replication protein DnaC